MSAAKAKLKIATFQYGALLIAIGETVINKGVSFEAAQSKEQRDYVVSRLTMNGLSVEEAESIADAGLSGVEIASANESDETNKDPEGKNPDDKKPE